MGRNKKIDTEPVEQTIFDRYRKYIDSVKNKVIVGLEYGEAMEILRYVELKQNIRLGLNMNCGSCMISLIQMFAALEGK